MRKIAWLKQLRKQSERAIAGGAMALLAGLILPQRAIALDEATLLLLTGIPDPYTLAAAGQVSLDELTGAYNISQTSLSIPSLWWTQDQFGGKLVDTWFAFPTTDGIPSRVDVIVNQQVWSLYTYLERYTFLNQFGTAARDFGYSLRVFNRQQDLLAAYICDFPPSTAVSAETAIDPATAFSDATSLANCAIFLDSSGRGGLRGAVAPGAGLTTPADTVQP